MMKKPFTTLFASYILLTAVLLLSSVSAEFKIGGTFLLAFSAVFVMIITTLIKVLKTFDGIITARISF